MFDFPASPSTGTIFSPAGGPQYLYDGQKWKVLGSGRTAQARNRVCNPCMAVSQENGDNGSAATGALSWYPADQWLAQSSTTASLVSYRTPIPTPNGKYRIRIAVNAAETTPVSSEFCHFVQIIEGTQVADFQWGTANARQVVLRFGFKGPAGTYAFSLRNEAFNRGYITPFTVTAAQANTDTQWSFAIPGDVTGTWLTDNSVGIRLGVTLFAGPGGGYIGVAGWSSAAAIATAAITNNLAVTSSNLELFDVGLYLDPDATGLPPPFQVPAYDQDLIACQRYWQKTFTLFSGQVASGNGYYGLGSMQVPMRITPTATGVNSAAISFPATVGTLNAGNANTVWESRQANVTGVGLFDTQVNLNARM